MKWDVPGLGFSLNFGGEIHLKMYLQIEWRLHTPSQLYKFWVVLPSHFSIVIMGFHLEFILKFNKKPHASIYAETAPYFEKK
jgi:hypothetical protein